MTNGELRNQNLADAGIVLHLVLTKSVTRMTKTETEAPFVSLTVWANIQAIVRREFVLGKHQMKGAENLLLQMGGMRH